MRLLTLIFTAALVALAVVCAANGADVRQAPRPPQAPPVETTRYYKTYQTASGAWYASLQRDGTLSRDEALAAIAKLNKPAAKAEPKPADEDRLCPDGCACPGNVNGSGKSCQCSPQRRQAPCSRQCTCGCHDGGDCTCGAASAGGARLRQDCSGCTTTRSDASQGMTYPAPLIAPQQTYYYQPQPSYPAWQPAPAYAPQAYYQPAFGGNYGGAAMRGCSGGG